MIKRWLYEVTKEDYTSVSIKLSQNIYVMRFHKLRMIAILIVPNTNINYIFSS